MRINVLQLIIAAVFVGALILAGSALAQLTLKEDSFANTISSWPIFRTTVVSDSYITLDTASQIDHFILEAQSNQLTVQPDPDFRSGFPYDPDVGSAQPEVGGRTQTGLDGIPDRTSDRLHHILYGPAVEQDNSSLEPAKITVIIN